MGATEGTLITLSANLISITCVHRLFQSLEVGITLLRKTRGASSITFLGGGGGRETHEEQGGSRSFGLMVVDCQALEALLVLEEVN